MKIVSIFARDESDLWAVCYYVDGGMDVFTKLFKLWNDTEYLQEFFVNNATDLNSPFWEGITIEDAIDQVLDEAADFERELWSIDTKQPGYETTSLHNVFERLHGNIYALKTDKDQHRKARTNPNIYDKPMLRIYAIELDKECFVVTGGAIKLTKKMIGERFDIEFSRLDQVQAYLQYEGISSKEGLIT